MRWSWRKFGSAKQLLKIKTKQLEALQRRECPALLAEIFAIQSDIDGILEQEDIMWKQRAKQNWNTQYFHAWANHRWKINGIKIICDEAGRVWKKKKEGKAFIDYFQNLFTSQGPIGVEECLSDVESCVTAEMNSNMLRSFTEADVSFALSQMHPLKSPGPDGFSVCFYHKLWATVGKVVSQAVLQFLNGGVFDAAINSTNLVLIPKVSYPSRLTEYRPISLCNVIYKIIAKVLANRLKVIVPFVSPQQSAFIPGRLILVAFEVLHTMDTRYEQSLRPYKIELSRVSVE